MASVSVSVPVVQFDPGPPNMTTTTDHGRRSAGHGALRLSVSVSGVTGSFQAFHGSAASVHIPVPHSTAYLSLTLILALQTTDTVAGRGGSVLSTCASQCRARPQPQLTWTSELASAPPRRDSTPVWPELRCAALPRLRLGRLDCSTARLRRSTHARAGGRTSAP